MPVDEVVRERSVMAMASTARVLVADGSDREASLAMDAAVEVLRQVEATCSRFDPTSELSRANARPSGPHEASELLLEMVALAAAGHRSTGGRFDPRVLSDLEDLGYDRTFLEVEGDRGHLPERPSRPPWTPTVDVRRSQLDLCGEPIDLGGMAKGAAADLALRAMERIGVHGLVDVGGDGAASGPDGLGAPWSIGIEDPMGGAEPLAVFSLSTGGYATSSIRLRHWEVAGAPVHHLLDPATGRPGGADLQSVTVLASSGAAAEIAAKSAFLVGLSGIASHAEGQALACCWVDCDGHLRWSSAMAASLLWVRP